MKGKKLISALLSAVLLGSACNLPFANAAVIEPEIVKTETWTTSYYIDDDESTTYPYIDCQADIYSDGTVKCYFWNTHEWDGFSTVQHNVTIVESKPYDDKSREYMFKTKRPYDNEYYTYYPTNSKGNTITDYSAFENIDLSYYPKEYKYNSSNTMFNGFSSTKNTQYYYFSSYKLGTSIESNSIGQINHYSYKGAMPYLPVNQKTAAIFTPIIDITKEYTIRFLGHDIIVSPDILSNHIVATPHQTEQEKYIAELEKKNLELTEEISKLKANPSDIQNSISRLDANNDGTVNSVDASIILCIYAYNSTNSTPIETFDQYNELKK